MDRYRDKWRGSHATARYIGCQLGTSLFVTLSHVDDGRCWWLGLFVNGHLWLVLCLGTSHSSRLAGSCGHLFGSMQTTGHSLDHAGQFHWGLLFVKSLCDCDFHGVNAHAIDYRYHCTNQSVWASFRRWILFASGIQYLASALYEHLHWRLLVVGRIMDRSSTQHGPRSLSTNNGFKSDCHYKFVACHGCQSWLSTASSYRAMNNWKCGRRTARASVWNQSSVKTRNRVLRMIPDNGTRYFDPCQPITLLLSSYNNDCKIESRCSPNHMCGILGYVVSCDK